MDWHVVLNVNYLYKGSLYICRFPSLICPFKTQNHTCKINVLYVDPVNMCRKKKKIFPLDWWYFYMCKTLIYLMVLVCVTHALTWKRMWLLFWSPCCFFPVNRWPYSCHVHFLAFLRYCSMTISLLLLSKFLFYFRALDPSRTLQTIEDKVVRKAMLKRGVISNGVIIWFTPWMSILRFSESEKGANEIWLPHMWTRWYDWGLIWGNNVWRWPRVQEIGYVAGKWCEFVDVLRRIHDVNRKENVVNWNQELRGGR